MLFIIPYHGRALVGTTDTIGGDVDRPTTGADDIEYILRHCNRYLNVNLTREDIISTYAGFRPLLKSKQVSSSKLSRSHAVLDGPGGMISIVGGKLTTWRRMAEDTVNALAKRDRQPRSGITRHLPLDGTAGWPQMQDELKKLSPDLARHLGSFYGGNAATVLELSRQSNLSEPIVADLPYLLAEVVYACRYEMAMTVDDFLCRRSRLVLEDQQQGVGVAARVAALMGEELGWDEAEQARQIASYRENLAWEYQGET